MRFRIDVVFLDRWGWPIEVRQVVRPGRVVSCRAAAAVLEMRAGDAARHFVPVAWNHPGHGRGNTEPVG
jgi:hypothetical protein